MKTKNKMLAMLEIAIVLCSVFLVALPCIAADQKQETQKVSASEVTTTASEDDFVLEIYGNANEDDCIDMRDYTYTARIICWLEEESTLADANYDGRISVADMTQIGLIILGRESELTLVDSVGRSKTFYKPVERIIPIDDGNAEPLRVLGAEDLVVGVSSDIETMGHSVILPEMSKLPTVGYWEIDYEKVLSLNPDIVITFADWPVPLEELEEKLEPHGIQILCADYMTPAVMTKSIIKLGYLLGKQDKAEEFVTFREGVIDKIKSQTEGLSEDEKPSVYIGYVLYETEGYMTCSKGSKGDTVCSIAGGINIAHDLTGSGPWLEYPVIDSEWVLEQNLDFIVGPTFGGDWGYTMDEIQKQEWETEMEVVRDEIMSRPGWEYIKAVQNGSVYIVSGDIAESGLTDFVYTTFMAKWFHPDLFEDLDPETIHQEYVDRFIRIDHDVKKDAFVYPG